MENIYLKARPYTECLVTLEDYVYGEPVKCTIPSIIKPLKHKLPSKANSIMNKDSEVLGINKNVKCEDFITVIIPKHYASDPSNLNTGKKGDKYAISFIGGGLFEYSIIGRVDING